MGARKTREKAGDRRSLKGNFLENYAESVKGSSTSVGAVLASALNCQGAAQRPSVHVAVWQSLGPPQVC